MTLAMTTPQCVCSLSSGSGSNRKLLSHRLIPVVLFAASLLPAACRDNAPGSSFSSLNPPFSLNEIRPATGDEIPVCRAAPSKPIKNLVLGNVYKRSDPTRSEIDDEARDIYQGQTKALNAFQDRLSKSANAYLKSGGTNENGARCALDWLYEWAEDGALLGDMNVQGTYARQWALAGFASSYLQVKSYSAYDENKKRAIDQWLEDVARAVMNDYADISLSAGRQNNHLYWAAWAVTATGLVTDKKEFYDWGVGKVKYALHVQAQSDGTLPLELTRGKKALQYHVFALAPLIMVSEAATRNGENLYKENDGMLHKIVDRVFAGLQDPSYFQQKTGVTQIPGDSISAMHFSWLEAYNARFPEQTHEEFLEAHRPVISPRTGGDMTFLYHGA